MTARALIFDCDGVLAETEKDGHRVAFNRTFEESGVPLRWGVAEYGSLLTIGGGKERMRAALTPELRGRVQLPTDAGEVDALVQAWHRRKSALYRDIVAAGRLPGRPGVARLAAEALEAGWRLAVASTSRHESVQAVATHVFGADIAAEAQIYAGDVVARKKPAPDIYLHAASQLGVSVRDCVAIEDSPIGCISAVSAGMVCVITESEYTGGEAFEGAALVVTGLGGPDEKRSIVRSNPTHLDVDRAVRLHHLRQLLDTQGDSAAKGRTR